MQIHMCCNMTCRHSSVAHGDLWLRAGAFHTAVLTGLGKMYSWGAGDEGQLGLGHTDFHAAPQLVQALQDKDVRQIACGCSHSSHLPGPCKL